MPFKPTISIFTGSENFGDVFMEENDLTLKYFEFNLPFGDDSDRIASNSLGKIRTFIIQGATSGDGFSGATTDDKIAEFLERMDDWLNAKVSSSINYTDSLNRTYPIDGINFKWQRSFSDPNRILYTLTMKRA